MQEDTITSLVKSIIKSGTKSADLLDSKHTRKCQELIGIFYVSSDVDIENYILTVDKLVLDKFREILTEIKPDYTEDDLKGFLYSFIKEYYHHLVMKSVLNSLSNPR